jgi:hypothetical protein
MAKLVVEFSKGGIKSEIFLPKEFLNFEDWTNREPLVACKNQSF